MDQKEPDHLIFMELQEEIIKLKGYIVQLQNDNKRTAVANQHTQRYNNLRYVINNSSKRNKQKNYYLQQNNNEGSSELSKKLASDNESLKKQIITLKKALQESLQQIKQFEQNIISQFNELDSKNAYQICLETYNSRLEKKVQKYKSRCEIQGQDIVNLEESLQSYKKQVLLNLKNCIYSLCGTQNNNDEIIAERLEEEIIGNLEQLIQFKKTFHWFFHQEQSISSYSY